MIQFDNFLHMLLENIPSRNTAFLILDRMKKNGKTDNMEETCTRVLERYPDDIRIRGILAEYYMDKGLTDKAAEEIERASSMLDNLSYIYKLAAKIRQKQNNEQAAAASLKKYMAIHPDDRDVSSMLNNTMPDSTDTDGIEEDIVGKGHEEKEEDILVSPTIAELYFKQGKIDKAINAYKKVVEKNPADESSKQRIKQLLSMLDDSFHDNSHAIREKTERMITVMERWLTGIKEMNHA
ncbi:MAG: tetratricopeptide repeat protein [Deltaproteobacteria bacterium]|nr:tetratricopeptide repeat protein [Deltaproteobacteria bacterium]